MGHTFIRHIDFTHPSLTLYFPSPIYNIFFCPVQCSRYASLAAAYGRAIALYMSPKHIRRRDAFLLA